MPSGQRPVVVQPNGGSIRSPGAQTFLTYPENTVDFHETAVFSEEVEVVVPAVFEEAMQVA